MPLLSSVKEDEPAAKRVKMADKGGEEKDGPGGTRRGEQGEGERGQRRAMYADSAKYNAGTSSAEALDLLTTVTINFTVVVFVPQSLLSSAALLYND